MSLTLLGRRVRESPDRFRQPYRGNAPMERRVVYPRVLSVLGSSALWLPRWRCRRWVCRSNSKPAPTNTPRRSDGRTDADAGAGLSSDILDSTVASDPAGSVFGHLHRHRRNGVPLTRGPAAARATSRRGSGSRWGIVRNTLRRRPRKHVLPHGTESTRPVRRMKAEDWRSSTRRAAHTHPFSPTCVDPPELTQHRHPGRSDFASNLCRDSGVRLRPFWRHSGGGSASRHTTAQCNSCHAPPAHGNRARWRPAACPEAAGRQASIASGT